MKPFSVSVIGSLGYSKLRYQDGKWTDGNRPMVYLYLIYHQNQSNIPGRFHFNIPSLFPVVEVVPPELSYWVEVGPPARKGPGRDFSNPLSFVVHVLKKNQSII